MAGKRTPAGFGLGELVAERAAAESAFLGALGMVAAYSCLMKPERSVLAEGRLSSLVILTCAPIALLVGTILWLLNGGSPEDSMYYRASPVLVVLIMTVGMVYATYEFLDTTLRRRKYMSTDGIFIYVLHHQPIKISEIGDTHLEPGLLSDNLVILTRGGRKTKIRTHFLRESGQVVLRRLEELVEAS